jgi:ketosteroid isomerase-like protein
MTTTTTDAAAPDVAAAFQSFANAWRLGDADAVLALMASGEDILIGSPGPNPPALGRDAATAMVRKFVPLNAAPGAGQAVFHTIHAGRDGSTAWCYAEGILELPDKGRHVFRNTVAMGLEEDGWKWRHWCAFLPVPFPLIGTAALGFI